MKILVTGATGFIGQHVIAYLLKQQSVHIVATSTHREKAEKFSWFRNVQYIACDLYQPDVDFYNLFGQPDLLIHLAWQGLPNYQKRFHFEQNLMADYTFVKNMVVLGLKRLVVTGTCFEYGLQNGCLSEETPTKPVTSYGLAKDTLRKFIVTLLQDYPDRLFAWLRLFYLYGHGQNSSSLLEQLVQAVKKGEPVFNMSGGEQLRDYLPIGKTAEYIAKLATQSEPIGIINVCSGQPISVRSLVEKRLAEIKSSIKLNLGYYPYPDYEPMAFWGDNKKLKMLSS